MATSDQEAKPDTQAEGREASQRADNLLPDDAGAADGRFAVAEEVNLDQQSDAARHVGQAPDGPGSDALAESLKERSAPEPDAKH
jgi:hypothetical protein